MAPSRTIVAAGPGCGHRATCSSSTGARSGRCRCSARCSAWSRWRFVYFADNQRADTTLAALAACFEALGGVPATVLSDRMGCLKGATVAGLVVPTADYVRFATHYGFRPDFCEGNDPESKGLVENLVGYVKSDLMIPAELTVADLAAANAAGVVWRAEVNAAVHSEISAVPDERLAVERDLLRPLPSLRARIGKLVIRKVDRLSCVRFGSARYSVPTRHIGRQVEVRVVDGQLEVVLLGAVIADIPLFPPGKRRSSMTTTAARGPPPRPGRSAPRRPPRSRSAPSDPPAVAFIKAAAAAGNSKLAAISTSSPPSKPPTAATP